VLFRSDDAASNAAIREEKAQERFSELLTKWYAKLDLLRTNTAAKKRNTDLAFLTQMAAMDMAEMDAPVRAWFMSERRIDVVRLTTQII